MSSMNTVPPPCDMTPSASRSASLSISPSMMASVHFEERTGRLAMLSKKPIFPPGRSTRSHIIAVAPFPSTRTFAENRTRLPRYSVASIIRIMLPNGASDSPESESFAERSPREAS